MNLAIFLTACSSGMSATQCNAALNSWNQVVEQYGKYRQSIDYLKGDVIASTPAPAEAHPNPKWISLYALSVPTTTGDALMEKPYVESAVLAIFSAIQLGPQGIETDMSAFVDRLDNRKTFDASSNAWTQAQDGSGYFIALDTPVKTSRADWHETFGAVVDRMMNDYDETLLAMKDQDVQRCGGDESEVRSADDFR